MIRSRYWSALVQLVVVVDRRALRRAIEAALRRVGILGADDGADVVDGQAIGGQRPRIDHHAHRRPIAAADGDEPTPGCWLIFCASRTSARSSICVRLIVLLVSARVRIGVSAGLTLL